MEILSCSLCVSRSVGALAPCRRSCARLAQWRPSVLSRPLVFSLCTCALLLNIHLDSCDRTQAISFKQVISTAPPSTFYLCDHPSGDKGGWGAIEAPRTFVLISLWQRRDHFSRPPTQLRPHSRTNETKRFLGRGTPFHFDLTSQPPSEKYIFFDVYIYILVMVSLIASVMPAW